MKRFVLALWIAFGLAALSACANSPAAQLEIHDIWARPGISGGNSAVYFSVNNATQSNDTLLEARAQVAAHVELHQTTHRADGAMAMEQQASIPIPAGTRLDFMPGGLHIMLIDLQGDLQAGQTFELELLFENAGTTRLQVEVRAQGGSH